MNRWLALILVVLFIGWRVIAPHSPTIERVQAGPSLVAATALDAKADAAEPTDPCAGKERCAIIYVAPWCSACKATIPQMMKVREAWKDSPKRGMKFIVGADKPENGRQLTRELGEGAYFDTDDAYLKAMRVEHFPTIWIVDESQKVLEVDQGAYAWLNRDLRAVGR